MVKEFHEWPKTQKDLKVAFFQKKHNPMNKDKLVSKKEIYFQKGKTSYFIKIQLPFTYDQDPTYECLL
ncbi:hypothetical protein Q8G71_36790, partial [Klebsiella pneumoniae]